MTNTEVAQSFYQAAAARDVPKVLSLLAPNVRFVQTPALPWGGEYEGHMGMMMFFGKKSASAKCYYEVTEFVDAGETVLALGRMHGTVEETGAPFEVRMVHVLTVAEGLIVEFRAYIDTPGMLAALNAE